MVVHTSVIGVKATTMRIVLQRLVIVLFDVRKQKARAQQPRCCQRSNYRMEPGEPSFQGLSLTLGLDLTLGLGLAQTIRIFDFFHKFLKNPENRDRPRDPEFWVGIEIGLGIPKSQQSPFSGSKSSEYPKIGIGIPSALLPSPKL